MDDIYQLGLTNLFIELGLLVIKKFKIETLYPHLDSTLFHLHGEYNNIETAENYTDKSQTYLETFVLFDFEHLLGIDRPITQVGLNFVNMVWPFLWFSDRSR